MAHRALQLFAILLFFSSSFVVAQEPPTTTITLAWDAGGLGQDGYAMSRKLGQAGVYAEIGRVSTLTYNDTTAPVGQVVCYQVRAYAGNTLSDPSNEVCALVLLAPVNLRVTP